MIGEAASLDRVEAAAESAAAKLDAIRPQLACHQIRWQAESKSPKDHWFIWLVVTMLHRVAVPILLFWDYQTQIKV
jgi:hypothetical protein